MKKSTDFPEFCSFTCRHAVSPGSAMDGSRSCMTFGAIACKAQGKKVVLKGTACPMGIHDKPDKKQVDL